MNKCFFALLITYPLLAQYLVVSIHPVSSTPIDGAFTSMKPCVEWNRILIFGPSGLYLFDGATLNRVDSDPVIFASCSPQGYVYVKSDGRLVVRSYGGGSDITASLDPELKGVAVLIWRTADQAEVLVCGTKCNILRIRSGTTTKLWSPDLDLNSMASDAVYIVHNGKPYVVVTTLGGNIVSFDVIQSEGGSPTYQQITLSEAINSVERCGEKMVFATSGGVKVFNVDDVVNGNSNHISYSLNDPLNRVACRHPSEDFLLLVSPSSSSITLLTPSLAPLSSLTNTTRLLDASSLDDGFFVLYRNVLVKYEVWVGVPVTVTTTSTYTLTSTVYTSTSTIVTTLTTTVITSNVTTTTVVTTYTSTFTTLTTSTTVITTPTVTELPLSSLAALLPLLKRRRVK